ncbi:MAG: CFI-box-CTERM domain-containing protein [Pseudobdellovibrio sp.]
MKNLFITIVLFLFCLTAHAGFTITSVNGGSYSETDSSGAITLYGGIAGNCSGATPYSTCNTCTNTVSATACNQFNIHSGLYIGISFKSDEALANKKINIGVGTNANNVNIVKSTDVNVGASSTVELSSLVTWGDICATAESGVNSSSCTGASGGTPTHMTSNLKIYVLLDSDSSVNAYFNIKFQYVDITSAAINQQTFCNSVPNSSNGLYGMCGFKLGVGDQKFYIQEIYSTGTAAPNNYTNSGVPEWYGVAFFTLAGTSPTGITTGAVVPTVMKYNASYYVEDNVISGLQNYQPYCTMMGNVNKTQNIFLLNTGGAINTANVCGVPSEVVGLLDDKSCFISTAAFGSQMSTEVDIFRKFRNQFLLKHDWGVRFVKAYYKYSPPAAEFISQSEALRFVARLFLYPLYFFALLSLHYGLVTAIFSLFICLIGIHKVRMMFKYEKYSYKSK